MLLRRSHRVGNSRRGGRKKRRRRLVGLQPLETRLLLAGDAPNAVDDVFAARENVTVVIDVLANDNDAENDPLNITAITQGSGGTVINNGASVTYDPNAGFLGTDTFTYTISDGTSTDTATVRVTINDEIDGDAARSTILAGVTTLADPGGPGRMVVFGETAYSIANYPGTDLSNPMIAAASMGAGRVIAVGDHQWLNMNTHGGDPSTATFYQNGIEWLASTSSQSIKVVTLNNSNNANWLTSQGYSNVVNASTGTLATELATADVFVGAWLGSNPSPATLDTVDAFVKDGGGLFLADYGIGYDWWWNKETPDIPGNLLLRDAGIGFTKDWPAGGSQSVSAATGQMTANQVIDLLRDSSSATTAEKDQAAAIMDKLSDVLAEDDLLKARLDAEFYARINSIHPTPASPVTDSLDKALLRREMDLIRELPPAEVTAHRTAEDVYGSIPASAPRLSDHVVSINTDHSGYLPTGMYAAPGELVTVTVPAALVGQGYQLRISGHVDNISGRGSWNRVPYGVARSFPIDNSTVQIASAFGGAIYIDVGGQAAGDVPNLGDLDVTIDGAVEAPLFILGETTDTQWLTIRDNPAPFAELVSDAVSISLPSDAIRTLDNPTAVMTLWNDAVAFQDWVGGFDLTRTGPDRFNVDVQISVGYLHAGYPIQGPTSTGPGLVNYETLSTTGNWGYFHELGHEMQRHPELGWGYNNPWTFDGDIEVTVNIFANAALESAAPNSPTGGWGYSANADATMTKAITTVFDAGSPNFEDKDPYPFYFQLADGPWGWQGYRDVLSTYVDQQLNNPAALPQNNSEEKDQWLIRWSTATGYDMTEYMVDHWGLEVSQSAQDTVAAMSLPSWMPLAVQKSARKIDAIPGQGKTVDYATAGLGLDGVASFVSAGQPTEGQLVDNGDGTFTYQPHFSFQGSDHFEVTYESSAGNQQTFTVEVNVSTSGVLMESFFGIGGTSINDLTTSGNYPDSPDETAVLDSFEIPSNAADSYGVRTRAYLSAPATGDYTFWIASDDNGQLLLSSDTDPANASLIAHVPGWSGSRQWTKYSQQQSNVISLVEGQKYYIEALMKEGGGGDNLAVAWSGPGIAGPTVIDGQFLTVYGAAPYAPQVTEVLVNGSENGSRSVFTEVLVKFDSEVIVDEQSGDPLQIVNRESGETVNVDIQLNAQNTEATLTFLAGDSVQQRSDGSYMLVQGNYELLIDESLVGGIGQTLDGDSDGNAGGDFQFGNESTDWFFQMYADVDGDRDVDTGDLVAFANAFRKTSAQPGFDPRFDFDGDGDVDSAELIEFARTFRRTLGF